LFLREEEREEMRKGGRRRERKRWFVRRKKRSSEHIRGGPLRGRGKEVHPQGGRSLLRHREGKNLVRGEGKGKGSGEEVEA